MRPAGRHGRRKEVREVLSEEIGGVMPGEETPEGAMRRYGLMAAALLIAGGLAAIPNKLLHDPPHPPTIYLLVVLALVSGGICLLIPWQRLPRRSLHVVGAVGSIEVVLSVWFGDPIFAWYYVSRRLRRVRLSDADRGGATAGIRDPDDVDPVGAPVRRAPSGR